MAKEPVFVSTKDIRPLPKMLLDSTCALCNRPQAKWELVGEGFVCSCFLYRSSWAKELGRRNQVDDLVLDIEGQVHENFKRTPQGELVEVEQQTVLLLLLF